jgi:transposase
MAKTYRPYLPNQDFLLPPSLRDWLPEDHLVYFVSDLVDELDLSAITTVYEDEERGLPPYHPVMLTKVLVYAYCIGIFSSRRIQRRLAEDVGFRVLAAGNQPDFRTIADFRKRHLTALRGFFEQVLRLAREMGAPHLGRVALDGSKVKANASKHKAMSYKRMGETQRQLRAEVAQLLAEAEAADTAEDAQFGTSRGSDDLPAELYRRESRLQRIREAKRVLKARAQEEAVAAGQPAESAKPVRLEFVVRPPLGAGPGPGNGRPNARCSTRRGRSYGRRLTSTACGPPTTRGCGPRCSRPGNRQASVQDPGHSRTAPGREILAAPSRSGAPRRGVTGAHAARS